MGFGVIGMVLLSIAINLGVIVWRVMVETVVPKIQQFCWKRAKIEEKQPRIKKTKQGKKPKMTKEVQDPGKSRDYQKSSKPAKSIQSNTK